jgi:SAM-dependent methyltransferase
MTASPEQIAAGQAVYTPAVLRLYDLAVLGVSNRFVWKCPTPRLRALYDANASGNHLDVGVGTGYFLDHCRFPVAAPRIGLMDLNPAALRFAADRIARHSPEVYRCNVLERIAFDAPKFDSVGVNYLLHCLPGAIAEKAIVFDHLKALANESAVFFGATLLQGGVERSTAARRLMDFYNRKGVFSNTADDLDGLRQALVRRFRNVDIDIIGCAALFVARV